MAWLAQQQQQAAAREAEAQGKEGERDRQTAAAHQQAAAMHPQQPSDQQRDQKQQRRQANAKAGQQERILMKTSNATSLSSNRETALARKAHFQAIQQACLNEAQVAAMKNAACQRGNTYIGGPTEPRARPISGWSGSSLPQGPCSL